MFYIILIIGLIVAALLITTLQEHQKLKKILSKMNQTTDHNPKL
jgi:hypothetical protein